MRTKRTHLCVGVSVFERRQTNNEASWQRFPFTGRLVKEMRGRISVVLNYIEYHRSWNYECIINRSRDRARRMGRQGARRIIRYACVGFFAISTMFNRLEKFKRLIGLVRKMDVWLIGIWKPTLVSRGAVQLHQTSASLPPRLWKHFQRTISCSKETPSILAGPLLV